jgi:hypothetical protein
MPSDPCALDRRAAKRRAPQGDEPLSRVRLRAGRELAVVDVSDGGALVEGPARLLPGTHVDAHLVTSDGRTLVRSRVVRAYVHHLDAQIVRYRGGIAFERPIDTSAAGYEVPELLAAHAAIGGSAYPDSPAVARALGEVG